MAQLITVEKTGKVKSKITFKAVFLGIPLMDDAVDAQTKAGYHPAGYGGPMDLRTKPLDNGGKYEATWTCYDSCD